MRGGEQLLIMAMVGEPFKRVCKREGGRAGVDESCKKGWQCPGAQTVVLMLSAEMAYVR